MTGKKNKSQTRQYTDQNPIEAFRGIGKGVAQSLSSDLAKSSVNDLWNQILGADQYEYKRKPANKSGDLAEGEELDLRPVDKKANDEKLPNLDIEPGLDYRKEIIHAETRIIREDTRAIEINIKEILIELKKLTASSKELQIQFKEVTIEQRIENPGKYHLTFFEWLLTTIKVARMKVEDSASWLSLFASKKGKREYWSMFKKHGTTFGLSNERVVSTQTG